MMTSTKYSVSITLHAEYEINASRALRSSYTDYFTPHKTLLKKFEQVKCSFKVKCNVRFCSAQEIKGLGLSRNNNYRYDV
jgi:hypothetical protein